MLLAFLFYFLYVISREKKISWYVFSLLSGALAMMSKSMAVTLPALLLLFDVWPLNRSVLTESSNRYGQTKIIIALVLEKAPFLLLSLVTILLTLGAQENAMQSLSNLGLLDRLLNASYGVMFYIRKFFIPIGYSPLYPHELMSGTASLSI